MAKPFSPTVGVHQPHLQNLEEMELEKYFLNDKRPRKSLDDFLYEQGAHIEGRPCPKTGKKYHMEDVRFVKDEGLNYGSCSECDSPIIRQAYYIHFDKKGKMKKEPIPPKKRWILETIENKGSVESLERGRQKVYYLKKKSKNDG